jgi:hypothetical protein
MKPVISLSSETYSTGEVPGGVGSVSGTVSYYDSQILALTGIGGASIELSGGAYILANTTTTSTEEPIGTFNLVDVPAGSYTLNVYAEGYDDYSQNIEVIVDADTVVDVVFLAEEPGGISGSVVDSGTTLAIEGATVSVELVSLIYSFDSFTETDTEGNFSIEQLPVGNYNLTVSADGYSFYSHAVEIAVTAGDTIEIGVIGLI